MPGSIWRRCWRRFNAPPPEDRPRGVSRKARRHIIRVRMPGSLSTSTLQQEDDCGQTNEQPSTSQRSTTGDGSKVLCESPRRPAPPSWGNGEGKGDAESEVAAAVVKVRRGGLIGMFRRSRMNSREDGVVMVRPGQTCVICLEMLMAGEVLQVLLCGHLYHERCIDRWLGDHTSCCICKADLEEMAQAVGKPARRTSRIRSSLGCPRRQLSDARRSRPIDDARSVATSGSDYVSDQTRSTMSMFSAPAGIADWALPLDNGRCGSWRETQNEASVLLGRPRESERERVRRCPRAKSLSAAMKEMERDGRK